MHLYKLCALAVTKQTGQGKTGKRRRIPVRSQVNTPPSYVKSLFLPLGNRLICSLPAGGTVFNQVSSYYLRLGSRDRVVL